MSKRLRIQTIIVQPVLVWDDGDEITEGPPVQQLSVPISQLAALVDALPLEVQRLQR
jgi:hypothetical protein